MCKTAVAYLLCFFIHLVISFVLVTGSVDANLPVDVVYAQKALETLKKASDSLCLGMVCSDGVLLAKLRKKRKFYSWEVLIRDEMEEVVSESDPTNAIEMTRCLDPDSPIPFDKSIHMVDGNVKVAISGWQTDVAFLLRHIKEMCREYKNTFGVAMSVQQVAEKVSSFLHLLSVESGYSRPLVVSVLVGGVARNKHAKAFSGTLLQLQDGKLTSSRLPVALGDAKSYIYKVDCSGVMREFAAAATGGLVSEDLESLRRPSEFNENDDEDNDNDNIQSGGILAKLSSVQWASLTMTQALERLKDDEMVAIGAVEELSLTKLSPE